jgi:glycerate-2-kinase
VNEPTAEGIAGTEQMMRCVSQAGQRDLCIALISGGGSALMPLPIAGITLADKLAVTRFLSGAGADIRELNTVRKHLSQVKGGGLLRACRAGALVTLVLSDVLGDPLDLIASGPTVPDRSSPGDALAVLRKYDPQQTLPASIFDALVRAPSRAVDEAACCPSTILVIGNNALAVDQAGCVAERLGYHHAMHSAHSGEGPAEDVGRHLADLTAEMLRCDGRGQRTDCLITGGEPTVTLIDAKQRGRGGRNQQLVLAAYQKLVGLRLSEQDWDRLCLLSGGTDGEDGPTDAAGAVLDADVHRRAAAQRLDPTDFLRRNDAYRFFEQTGGLLISGPTGTNVCDLRVALARPS